MKWTSVGHPSGSGDSARKAEPSSRATDTNGNGSVIFHSWRPSLASRTVILDDVSPCWERPATATACGLATTASDPVDFQSTGFDHRTTPEPVSMALSSPGVVKVVVACVVAGGAEGSIETAYA